MNLLQGKWPRLATLLAVLVAAALVFLAWERYTRTPWTRDARVRADVVTLSARRFRADHPVAAERQPARGEGRAAAQHRSGAL